jgi:hypothetical protein
VGVRRVGMGGRGVMMVEAEVVRVVVAVKAGREVAEGAGNIHTMTYCVRLALRMYCMKPWCCLLTDHAPVAITA